MNGLQRLRKGIARCRLPARGPASSPWRALAVVAPLAVGVIAAANCAVMGFDLADGGRAGATSSGGGFGGGGGNACGHATWPSPPTTSDPGPDVVDLVVAIRSVDFGEGNLDDGPTVGYDLDQRCTCQGQAPSCLEPAWATKDHCDGPAGRDNAVAQLFGTIGVFNTDMSSEVWTAQIESGDWSLLLRVQSYNGKANDEQVVVAVYPSPGLDEDPCNGPDPVPAWDGTDRWPVSATALTGGGSAVGGSGGCGGDSQHGYDVDDPRYVDSNAYVTDWVVVAGLPEVALILDTGFSHTVVKLTAGFITGRLEHDPSADRWALHDGLLVGRWKMVDFFQMLSNLVTTGGVPLCTDNPAYAPLKATACPYVDIVSSLGAPTTPCDAISFGLAFEAMPARIGAVDPSAPPQTPCAPAQDPSNDECGAGGS